MRSSASWTIPPGLSATMERSSASIRDETTACSPFPSRRPARKPTSAGARLPTYGSAAPSLCWASVFSFSSGTASALARQLRFELRFCCRVSLADSPRQTDPCAPAQRMHARHIQQLARRAIGLGRVESQLTSKPKLRGHQLCQLADRHIFSRSYVDQRRMLIADQLMELTIRKLHQDDACLCQIVAIEQLAPRRAGTPYFDKALSSRLRLHNLAHQCRQHMRGLEIEVVMRTVKIRRHRRQVLRPVLTVIGPAHLDPGDLRQRIRPIRRLQRTRQQILLADRLRSQPRIDTARSQKEQPPHARLTARVADGCMSKSTVANEVRRIGIVVR